MKNMIALTLTKQAGDRERERDEVRRGILSQFEFAVVSGVKINKIPIKVNESLIDGARTVQLKEIITETQAI